MSDTLAIISAGGFTALGSAIGLGSNLLMTRMNLKTEINRDVGRYRRDVAAQNLKELESTYQRALLLLTTLTDLPGIYYVPLPTVLQEQQRFPGDQDDHVRENLPKVSEHVLELYAALTSLRLSQNYDAIKPDVERVFSTMINLVTEYRTWARHTGVGGYYAEQKFTDIQPEVIALGAKMRDALQHIVATESTALVPHTNPRFARLDRNRGS